MKPGKLSVFFLFSAALFTLGRPSEAQEFRGSILGRVTDPSGALVPGAEITVKNEETNVSMSAVSNADGNYNVPFISPGRYTVSVSLPGFKTIVRNGIVVQVQDKIVLDFVLEVGGVTESVTVTSETPLLRIADANLGQVVNRHFLERLPISGQSPLMLADMAPGVVAGGGGTTSNAQNDILIGGGNGNNRGNDVTVDGIPNVAPRQRGLAVTIPMGDALEEFKVATTMFDASNGRSNGGVLALSTRSGTNEYHGSAYSYFRNRALDANSWTNNRLGLVKPPVNYHLWGGTVGGPVRFPHYNGRDRTFFFFGYEKTSNRRPITREARVPTELERKGDFSQTLASKGGPLSIYDPYSTVVESSGKFKSRTAFAGAKIPENRLNPVGVAVLGQYPLPTKNVTPQIGGLNWAGATTQTVDTQNWHVRVDQQVSGRQRIYARFSALQHLADVTPTFFAGAYNIPPQGTTDLNADTRRNKSVALDDTYTLSPTFVGSLRYGYTRTFISSKFDGDNQDPSVLKLPEVILRNQTGGGWPIFNLGESLVQIGSRPRLSINDIHALLATFNKLQGNHTLKFGMDYRLVRWNESNPNTYANGQFQFNNTFTRSDPSNSKSGDTSGTAMASLLLGLPTTGSGSRIGYDSPLSLQSHYLALFFQDDFKLSPHFTLNLGMRYELETPFTERFDRLAYGFDPNAAISLTVPGLAPLKGGLLFVSKDSLGRREGVTDWKNFGPRFGVAWSPDTKTAVRGGYGVFFSSGVVNISGGTPQTTASFGAITSYVGSTDVDYTPVPGVSLSNPFPNGVSVPTGSSLGAMTELGKTIRFDYQDRVLPYIQQWQLSVQRELRWRSVVEIAYAGAHSVKNLEHGFNLDETPDPYRRNIEKVTNPFRGILAASTPLGGSTIAANKLTVRFPQFDQVNLQSANTGRTLYHALQVRLQKRTSNGLTLVSSYAFSKAMTYPATSLVNERHYRSVSPLDFPHVFRLYATYDLPVGRGRMLGKEMPAWLDVALGGWSMTWITGYTSGAPLGITDSGRDTSYGRPIPIRDPNTPGSLKERLGDVIDPVTKLPRNPYLDPNAFLRMADQFAVTPEPPQYGWMRSPGILFNNLTVFKSVRLRERAQFEVRAEMSNLFNSPQFGAPLTDIATPATFGTITSAGGNRTVLVGAKIRF